MAHSTSQPIDFDGRISRLGRYFHRSAQSRVRHVRRLADRHRFRGHERSGRSEYLDDGQSSRSDVGYEGRGSGGIRNRENERGSRERHPFERPSVERRGIERIARYRCQSGNLIASDPIDSFEQGGCRNDGTGRGGGFRNGRIQFAPERRYERRQEGRHEQHVQKHAPPAVAGKESGSDGVRTEWESCHGGSFPETLRFFRFFPSGTEYNRRHGTVFIELAGVPGRLQNERRPMKRALRRKIGQPQTPGTLVLQRKKPVERR